MEAVKMPTEAEPWPEDDPAVQRMKELGIRLPEKGRRVVIRHPPVELQGDGPLLSAELVEDRR